MASPFPGMDPYLEQHWGDVHASLVIYMRDQLQAGLPRDLLARVEERVFVESSQAPQRVIYPDVRVVEQPSGGGGGAAVATLPEIEQEEADGEPLVLQLGDDALTDAFIEIIDAATGNRVITVIEVLSLANKAPGMGQHMYLKKQREVLDAGLSLVEIDLLRSGDRVLSVPTLSLPAAYRTDYRVSVRRGWQRWQAEVYRVPLRRKLPLLRVPLRESDPDARLDLQALIAQCYVNGRYDRLDYTQEAQPPLPPVDARWADELLRAKGLR